MTNDTQKLNWQAIGVGIAVALAMVAFNAWCMNLIIDNAISKNMITIMEKYCTKADLCNHVATMHRENG
jgi:hypothetical protein